jgi:hypothetical protein
MRALVILSVLLTATVVAACGENSVKRYATIQDAKKDKLFERGWVPEVLPETAGPLTEAHNLDTNARCALVEFPASELDEVLIGFSREGFERYEGDIPALPLNSCPFSANDFRHASIVLRRTAVTGDREFAGVNQNGTFIFMGMQ